jgi:hypothetical protein
LEEKLDKEDASENHTQRPYEFIGVVGKYNREIKPEI